MLGVRRLNIWLIIFAFLPLGFAGMCYGGEDTSTIDFLAVGDVMLSGRVQEKIKEFGANSPFEKVHHLTNEANLAFCNLECAVTSSGTNIIKPNILAVNPQEAEGLSFAGFDIVSLANNHALDKGREGLLGTMRFLEKEGIEYVGAGKDYQEAREPTILVINGIRVAFLAYCLYPLEGVVFRRDAPSVSLFDPQVVREAIENIKKQVDVIVVSLHWGTEYAQSPSLEQQDNAHRIVDWGADLILGHHPHVIQKIEEYKQGVIVYSLGNFIFDQQKPEAKKSIVFKAKISKNGVEEYSTLPVEIVDFRPQLSTD
jgi:poly-gamma-glutamate capsule biosynthesis protein CapA/YwtB (metallophosphatase superfamily)